MISKVKSDPVVLSPSSIIKIIVKFYYLSTSFIAARGYLTMSFMVLDGLYQHRYRFLHHIQDERKNWNHPDPN